MGDTYYTRHNHGIPFLIKLPNDEDSQKRNEADEEANDSAAIPRMRLASILKSKNVAGQQADHQTCAYKVELQDLFLPGGFNGLCGFCWFEEEEGDSCSDSADRQIDPEAL
jgi:hypothetical protein